MRLEFVSDYTEHRGAEDWGENRGNWVLEGGDNAVTKNAVAPAEACGMEKYDGMFKRDSPDVAWKVAFKTMRKARTGDNRLPSGFPQLWTFFHEARSLRVFQWGLRKYQELYPDCDGWDRWVGQPSSTSDWHPQRLRVSIWTHCDREQCGAIKESTNKPYKVTAVQRQIISWTMSIGLWDKVPIEAAPSKIRALRNWTRVRRSLLVVAFVGYVYRQVQTKQVVKKRPRSPSLEAHEGQEACDIVDNDELFGDSDADDDQGEWGCVIVHVRSGCVSPSLKRVCA